MLTRRDTLKLLALAGVGAATGCATFGRRPDARRRLPPVRVAADREIRTVVGLRPFRPSGFRVAAEPLGDKLVVHNYGHGGAGVTLSWGTADLATRLALASSPARSIAVIGAGAFGLATARLLQLRGATPTIYAAALPPDTTSNIAAAQVFPFLAYGQGALVSPFREQFVAAAHFSYHWYQLLVGPLYGVRWMTNYLLGDDKPGDRGLTGWQSPIRDMLPQLADLGAAEHPFAQPWVRRFASMMVDTPVYLNQLQRDVRLGGATFVVRRFESAAELAALPEPTLINCTGLGAKPLFADEELTPVKGQLTVLLPQPEVDYAVIYRDLYMFSRRDGVLLGGTHQEGEWSLEPDLAAKQRVFEGHTKLFGSLA